jgi:hypothetical protein
LLIDARTWGGNAGDTTGGYAGHTGGSAETVVVAVNTNPLGTDTVTGVADGGNGGSGSVAGLAGSSHLSLSLTSRGITQVWEQYDGAGGNLAHTLATITDMSGGNLTLDTLELTGDAGTFSHASNTLSVSTLRVGGNATYSMSGGTATSSTTDLAEFSEFHQTGGTATLGTVSGLGSLNIDSGGTATATNLAGEIGYVTVNGTLTISHSTATRQTSDVALQLDNLTMGSGGKFDINNHDMMIYLSMTEANLRSALIAGRGTGSWNGSTGITSSDANTNGMDLGYATADELGITAYDGSVTFDQLPVWDLGNLMVKYTFGGDANLDGKVDSADQAILTANLGVTSGGYWAEGDFNYDGAVNSADQSILTAHWLSGSGGIHGAPVPEPAQLTVIALGTMALLSRRRRCRA